RRGRCIQVPAILGLSAIQVQYHICTTDTWRVAVGCSWWRDGGLLRQRQCGDLGGDGGRLVFLQEVLTACMSRARTATTSAEADTDRPDDGAAWSAGSCPGG